MRFFKKQALCFLYPGPYTQYAFQPFQSNQDMYSIHYILCKA